MRDDISKEMVEAFESCRRSEQYDIIQDAPLFAHKIGVSLEQYWNIVGNYSDYLSKYGVERRD